MHNDRLSTETNSFVVKIFIDDLYKLKSEFEKNNKDMKDFKSSVRYLYMFNTLSITFLLGIVFNSTMHKKRR